jgi:hypothetical protein
MTYFDVAYDTPIQFQQGGKAEAWSALRGVQ